MILNAGMSFNFGVLPVPVLERTDLSTNARLCLAVLDGFGANAIFPHLPTIARRMGLAESSTKTVISAVIELVQGGFCDVKGGRGAHAPNYYFLKIPLYCRAENESLAQKIKAIPFPVNQMGWKPAIPGGGVIPPGHTQLSNGQVVPLDDVPALDPAAAAQAGLQGAIDIEALLAQVGASVEAAIGAAIMAAGGSAAALALGQRLTAVTAATCDMHRAGQPAAAVILGPSIVDPKKIFLTLEETPETPKFAHNNHTPISGPASTPAPAATVNPSPGQIRLSDNSNKVGQHFALVQTDKPSNEKERDKSIRQNILSQCFAEKELEAWQTWPAAWAKANEGRIFIWTAANLEAAKRITAATGPDLLAATLANFARHDYWVKHNLPLEALAKYPNEHMPAAAAVAVTAKPAAPVCKHEKRIESREFVNGGGQRWAMQIKNYCADCGQDFQNEIESFEFLANTVRLWNRQYDKDLLAELIAAAAAAGVTLDAGAQVLVA